MFLLVTRREGSFQVGVKFAHDTHDLAINDWLWTTAFLSKLFPTALHYTVAVNAQHANVWPAG